MSRGDNCRRSLRKRSNCRSFCCTCSVVFGLVFVAFRVVTWNSSREEKDFNILLSTLEKVKGIGKSSLLYVDRSEYIFADEQPDTSKHRNLIAKQPSIISTNLNTTRTTTLADKKTNKSEKKSETNAIEHDPSIDENAVPETFKWHINVERSTTCTPETPAKHAVLLRSHRTGSHTVGNIFYRFGDLNNLFFALPKAADFQHYWPLRFHHTRVEKSLLSNEPPNFLINTARNTRIKIKTFVSSETYKIAIMRDPVAHVQSVFESMLKRPVTGDSGAGDGGFERFAENPALYLEEMKNRTKLFDPVFYLLNNGQLFDFGYNVEDYAGEGSIDIRFVLHELEEYLDLVLITEYMDESLVLLQRMLCWQLSDVAYIKHKVRRNPVSPTMEQKRQLIEWNKYDSMLYNHFNTSLWEKLNKQDQKFWTDVEKLKKLNENLEDSCVNKTADEAPPEKLDNNLASNATLTNQNSSAIETEPLLKTDIGTDIKHICERMLLPETEYVRFLKLKQQGMLNEQHKKNNKILFRNTTEGKFYYEFFTTLSQRNKTTSSSSSTDDDLPGSDEPVEEITLGLSHTD